MKILKLLKNRKKYLKDNVKNIKVAIILIIFSTLIALSYGVLNGAAIEAVTKFDLKAAIFFFSIYLLAQIVGSALIRRKSKLVLNKVQLDLTYKQGYDIFKKALKLPVKVYEQKRSGEILNRIVTDTSTISELLYSLLDNIVDIFAAVIVLIYVFLGSWIIGLEIIIYIFLIWLISRKYMKDIKNNQKLITDQKDDCVSDINQNILGIREIKSLGARKKVNLNVKNMLESLVDKQTKQLDLETKYSFLIKTMNSFVEVIVFITCAILVYYKVSSITFFIAITWYVYRFMWVVDTLSTISRNYQKVIVAMERTDEILLNEISDDDVFGENSLSKIDGVVEFVDVDFGYNEESLILSDLNLKIDKNCKVAIIGKSGSGKTTLFNLLLRLYDPINGNIYIDGVDTKDLTEDSLRNHISIIRQDPFLFNKSFYNNFKIINPDITLSEVREHCKDAYIDEYIMSLDKKYDSIIGEGGVNLSGGQKQRLAIARALAKKSKIILFDEATSALDNQSQEYIKRTINSLSKDHTIIIIAHRLSTIEDADIIYLMDNGKIIAQGKHDYLIKNNKEYKKLYNSETVELNI